MNIERYTEKLTSLLQSAQTIALGNSNQKFLPEHVLQAFLDEVSAIADKNSILEMYSMATDEPFSFLTVKLTAKNKNDIFMIRFDKKLKSNLKNITIIFF